MAKQTVKTSILDVLNSATESDLEAINATIADLESQIEKHQAEILSLRTMRRTISIKLHGKPERKKPVRKTKDTSQSQTPDNGLDRQRIHDWLHKHGTPAKPGVIGVALGIHPARVASLCRHEWFEESISGFEIA